MEVLMKHAALALGLTILTAAGWAGARIVPICGEDRFVEVNGLAQCYRVDWREKKKSYSGWVIVYDRAEGEGTAVTDSCQVRNFRQGQVVSLYPAECPQ
jgi:hypothetical protein